MVSGDRITLGEELSKWRQQFVKLGSSRSVCLDIACSVPQGSVLEPTLFILYINDICSVFKLLKMVLFAFEYILFGRKLTATREMNKLKLWFDRNTLSSKKGKKRK